jgi:hypothetical protein
MYNCQHVQACQVKRMGRLSFIVSCPHGLLITRNRLSHAVAHNSYAATASAAHLVNTDASVLVVRQSVCVRCEGQSMPALAALPLKHTPNAGPSGCLNNKVGA